MELRHLRYFVAVAEELHFRRAAERLHVVQGAVSEQVRKLEEELGVQLFERTQRSVALTIAGQAMLEEARRVLRHAEVAQAAARAASQRELMRLRVGYLADALPAIVPRAVRRVVASSPGVDVELVTGPALRLVADVREGRLDAVVTTRPVPARGLECMPIGELRAVAVLPVGHALADRAGIGIEHLAHERIVVMRRDANPAFHDAVAAMCEATDGPLTFEEGADLRVEHVLLRIATGAGVGLMPETVAQRYLAPDVRFVPVEDAQARVETAVLTRPDAGELTRTFLTAVRRGAQVRAVEPLAPALTRPR